MSRSCVVGGCKRSIPEETRLHFWPADAALGEKWSDFIRSTRTWTHPTKWSGICSAHFDAHCFEETNSSSMAFGYKWELKPSAYPTVQKPGSVKVNNKTTKPTEISVSDGRTEELSPESTISQTPSDARGRLADVASSLHPATCTISGETQPMTETWSQHSCDDSTLNSISPNPLATAVSIEISERDVLLDSAKDQSTKNLINRLRIKPIRPKYACSFCNKVFARRSELLRHEAIHSKAKPLPLKYDCEICQKNFKTKWNLSKHMLFHSDDRPFNCPKCDWTFKDDRGLARHMITHSDKRPHHCQICDKGFKFKKGLNRHLVIHSDERPFSCEICDKRFKNDNIRNQHVLTHSSSKPFKCHLCERTYKTKYGLKEHMRTHSDADRETVICETTFAALWDCNMCDENFKSKSELISHIRTHGKDQPHV